jgi:DNA invertase Pin-like site-specific DNA recombinase
MSDNTKIGASHLSRAAYVYLRQSSPAQVEHNRESTQRQYALVSKASTLGWPTQQVVVIDEDLGLSGAGVVERSGFARLTAEVALGHVGIVLGLEVSRLARNNADWYRLLDLCGLTDTLIGDADGIYHPAMFNDRLLLGLKGTMSEAELHVLRARLNGGIRNKAARGELRRGLPVGFVWGEEDGEVRFNPDEAVCTAIGTVFARFSELGSVRRVWLWLRSEGLSFPLQTRFGGSIRWVDPRPPSNPPLRSPEQSSPRGGASFSVFREWVIPLLAPVYWLTTGPLVPYFATVWPGHLLATHAVQAICARTPPLGIICA